MFGKLQGIVDFVASDSVILMVGGAGYKIFLTPAELAAAKVGAAASFWIETILQVDVRAESSIKLIGFSDVRQQEMFLKLKSVSGIGTKLALGILGGLDLPVLETAIASGDVKTLKSISGVGTKAEKIITALKGKIIGGREQRAGNNYDDLVAALETLGYKRNSVVGLAQDLIKEHGDEPLQSLITLALKELGARG